MPFELEVKGALGHDLMTLALAAESARVAFIKDCLIGRGFSPTDAAMRGFMTDRLHRSSAELALLAVDGFETPRDPSWDREEFRVAGDECLQHSEEHVPDPSLYLSDLLLEAEVELTGFVAADRRYFEALARSKACIAELGFDFESFDELQNSYASRVFSAVEKFRDGSASQQETSMVLHQIAAQESDAMVRVGSCRDEFARNELAIVADVQASYLADHPGLIPGLIEAARPLLEAIADHLPDS